jgi:Putative beta-lactamase-inhibitor-like, PepSY-like
MKKNILLLVLIAAFVYGNVSAQVMSIPAEVTNAFKAKYADAQNVEWKAVMSDFLATFTLNGVQKTAEFNSNGEWIETDTKMIFDSIPDVVKDGFRKSNYDDWIPGAVTYVDNGKTQWYQIYAEKSSIAQKRFLYFNVQGQLVMNKPAL